MTEKVVLRFRCADCREVVARLLNIEGRWVLRWRTRDAVWDPAASGEDIMRGRARVRHLTRYEDDELRSDPITLSAMGGPDSWVSVGRCPGCQTNRELRLFAPSILGKFASAQRRPPVDVPLPRSG